MWKDVNEAFNAPPPKFHPCTSEYDAKLWTAIDPNPYVVWVSKSGHMRWSIGWDKENKEWIPVLQINLDDKWL